MKLFAIDPGPEQSAWVLYDTELTKPTYWAKEPNEDVRLKSMFFPANEMAVEHIASYGMAVGKEVFETCVWIGRYVESWQRRLGRLPIQVYRVDVKLHLCASVRAKDSNIRQAIIDRYGSTREAAIGKKASPGPLYGLKSDCWAALGVAITAAETMASGQTA